MNFLFVGLNFKTPHNFYVDTCQAIGGIAKKPSAVGMHPMSHCNIMGITNSIGLYS